MFNLHEILPLIEILLNLLPSHCYRRKHQYFLQIHQRLYNNNRKERNNL